MRSILMGLILLWPLADARAEERFLWWEAEEPASTNFPAVNPFAPEDQQQADALSEGEWIGANGERSEILFLEYEVELPEMAEYGFYVRKFWKHGPFRWRFDGQKWREVGRDISLLDAVELRQFIVANWVSLGPVTLEKGRHILRIEALERDGAIAFDAFLLTRDPFVPRGKLKPGERLARAPEGWFPFEPAPDDFGEAKLDLRFLNEDYAGQNGFIRAEGDHFVHGDSGRPIRFWGVNAGPDIARMDDGSIDYLARYLAKLGVNIVRVHGAIYDHSGSDLARVDEALVERIFYLVAALKEQGIYTALSIYFPLWIDMEEKYGFAGYTGNYPFALLFFNEDFQEIYRNWWRELLTRNNPHTGVPLNREAAVAFAELVNEDSYFFWTFTPYENIPGEQMHLLEAEFGEWLAEKYGSLEAAKTAWPVGEYTGDGWEVGRVGFTSVWNMFNRSTSQRSRDTVEFLTRHQKAFFAEMGAFLKEELGFQGAVYGSNWKTADDTILGPLDKYSNTVGDFMDRHGYFAPPHQGERASYALSEGDLYDDRSALLFQGQEEGSRSFGLPIMDLNYNGKPSTITEINWPMPNRFRADLPLLSAAYGLLQGTDGFFFFALSGPTWQQTHGKFPIQTPVIMGQFPATAFLYRQGLVETGEVVFDGALKLADLFALEGAPVTAPQNLELFRSRDIPPGGLLEDEQAGPVDPLAFLVGRVGLSISEKGGASKMMDLSPFIDRENEVVESASGELRWDYGRGLMTVDAPQAKGATGFLAGVGEIRLDGMAITSEMDYGSILLVALDGLPISSSERMLLQVMSEDANYGWSTSAPSGMREITDLGAPPIVVEDMQGTVRLQRDDAGSLQVLALDFAGYADEVAGTAERVELREETLYYLIERNSAQSTAVEEGTAALPEEIDLAQNFPNPFNGGTHIRFELSRDSLVTLGVFDLTGQKVVDLVDEERPAGSYLIDWDGCDEAGTFLASGLYFYRLQTEERRITRKLLLVR